MMISLLSLTWTAVMVMVMVLPLNGDSVIVDRLCGVDGDDGDGNGDSVIVGDSGHGDDIIVVVAHLGGGEEEGARLPSLPLPQTPRIIFHLGNISLLLLFSKLWI